MLECISKQKGLNSVGLHRENLTNDVSAAGKDLASETSDTMSDKSRSRHHLLQLKLTLDEGTSGNNVEAAVEQQNKRAAEKSLTCKHIFN